MWGRSWRSNNKPTHPDKAESFRIWIKVNEKIAKDLFRKSGFTFPPYYVEIKNEDSQQARLRILWIPKDIETADAISKTPRHQGLIRGRTDVDLQKAFAEMYPGRTIPLQIEAFFLASLGSTKLSNDGHNCGFLEGAQIKGKLLTKLGANWKVCAEENSRRHSSPSMERTCFFNLCHRKATPRHIAAP